MITEMPATEELFHGTISPSALDLGCLASIKLFGDGPRSHIGGLPARAGGETVCGSVPPSLHLIGNPDSILRSSVHQ